MIKTAVLTVHCGGIGLNGKIDYFCHFQDASFANVIQRFEYSVSTLI